MPIEHEHKFVLNPTKELFERMKKQYYPALQLTQFYVSDAARYREVRPSAESWFGTEWFFTHKMAIGRDVLEHEMNVSHADFGLAQERALGILYKVRMKTKSADGGAWDVDFFLDGPHGVGEMYFAMAECEHTRGTDYAVLPAITDSVIYAVPEEEAHLYSNRRLTDIAYTRALLATIQQSR
ncbi:MAG: hypothetical protein EOP83_07815 [Verrucomicrobiaceae bacterium]|nr:MAG: hypothetical protein EOP83_07815 [Verrucomicrobiaceae bacterium]